MIQQDKVLHLAAGALLFAAGALLHPSLGLLLCAAGAYGKELYDRTGRGTFDGWDAAATLAGGMAVAAVWNVLR